MHDDLEKKLAAAKPFQDIEATARAIEADAGMPLEGLRGALLQARTGKVKRVSTPENMLVVETRKRLHLTQAAFSKVLNTPLTTLRDWEQGRSKPQGSAIVLCRLLMNKPDLKETIEKIA